MAAKACYAPNGLNRNGLLNATDGWLYAPCDNAASVSMCCAIGPGRSGSQDTCLESGLCQNVILASAEGYWRESCTDPTWQDPACLKLFVNGTGINSTMGIVLDDEGSTITDVNIRRCDNGSFCYGYENIGCCEQGEGVFLLNGEQVTFDPEVITSSTSSTIPTSTALSSTTTSSVFESSPTSSKGAPPPSAGLSTGAKAGIGVGATFGGIAVVALIVWIVWGHNRKSRKNRQYRETKKGHQPMPEAPPQPIHELPGPATSAAFRSGVSEMEGSSDWSGMKPEPPQKEPVDRYT